MSLKGRSIVITGSTRGIGRAIAEECARRGAAVIVSSRSEEAVTLAVKEMTEAGHTCQGIPADVSSVDDLQRLFDFAVEKHVRIDGWVNNAGISLGYSPLDDHSPEQLKAIVDVNLTGTMYASRMMIPYFRENGGILVNMSGRGFRGEASPFTAAYASTKAAISSLTGSLAKENEDAKNVSIHTLVPGMVATDFYTDIEVSPRLEHAKDNWRYALKAFGTDVEDVGRKGAEILAQEPGAATGKVYSLLTPGRLVRGIALISWYKMSGKLVPEHR